MDKYPLFDFESDFVDTLRCVPMVVRFKLDACGVKLSLRQWSQLTVQDRHDLRLAPCETDLDAEAFRGVLIRLVAERSGDQAKRLPEPADEAWRDRSLVPEQLIAFARAIDAPTVEQHDWASLTPLERFTLLKLSRDNHDNVNFVPALREFGLTDEPEPSAGRVAIVEHVRA